MIPDVVLRSRSLALLVCFCAIAFTFFFSPTGKTSPQAFKRPGFCMSDSSAGVVYFSPVFDTRLPSPGRISTYVIEREFVEYLKGRYDFKGPGNFASACPLYGRMIDAENTKRDFLVRARQANKQVVEVDWSYVVDPDLIAASNSNPEQDAVAIVNAKRKPDNTYCVSDSVQGTLYTTGPIETGTAVNLSLWYRGFDQLLRQKYAFKGEVYCNIGSSADLTRLLAARVAGARAAGRKIVDTAWKYDASAVATAPAKRDDDPEPVQRPVPPPNPSRQASDNAAKELPASVAFCRKDVALSMVFNCDSFGRVVYNYRMAHVNETPEPVASLVASHKLNCAECIDNTRVSLWAEKRGAADKLEPRTINCVSQNVIVTLYKTPEAERLAEFYKQAVATCRKQ